MDCNALKRAIERLERLEGLGELPEEVRSEIADIKRDLYTVLDSMIVARGKLYKMLDFLQSIVGAVGTSPRRGFYVEAALVYRPEGARVRVERTV